MILKSEGHAVGIHPSTGKPVFIRPDLRNGLLARAAAGAAAQRPAVPNGALSAQPQDSDQAAQAPETVTTAQAGGAVQRLKQQYEGTAPVEPAPLAEEVCAQAYVACMRRCSSISTDSATAHQTLCLGTSCKAATSLWVTLPEVKLGLCAGKPGRAEEVLRSRAVANS